MNDQPKHPITLTLLPILQALCVFSQSLDVTEEANDTELTIIVCPEELDRRTIAGKGGRIIDAINLVVAAAGQRIGVRARFEIDSEKRVNPRHAFPPFALNEGFGVDEVVAKLRPLADMVFGSIKIAGHMSGREEVVIMLKPAEESDKAKILAVSDIFFSLGYRQGRIIKIKPANDETTNPNGQQHNNRHSGNATERLRSIP